MAITTIITNAAKRISPYGVDLTTGTIKCALFTSVSNISTTSTLYSALTGEVASGNGYTTGGNIITDLAWTGTTSPSITGTIPAWTSASFTCAFAGIYDLATGKVLNYYNLGGDQTVAAGTFSLTFDSNGQLKVSSS